ncbi:hypothetical protein [Bacillus pseudomycoides]|uniref:hypothetical protein n=2 Tax=Bacillus pseudomycoides TaxID=64104 RepID=UPI00159BEABB|nr:hypothetical protein [Bacillus pseudomycoides]
MKRVMGVLSTGLLAGAMLFGVSSPQAYADSPAKPYQVITDGFDGEQTTIGFENKTDFENYLESHPVPKSNKVQPLASIYSTFYYDNDLKGSRFTVNASRNPVVVVNFGGSNNDNVSSILTHPYGDYTTIYEHVNAEGRALAIVNNGKYINLTDVSMGDGARTRTWNDEVSSAIVKSN